MGKYKLELAPEQLRVVTDSTQFAFTSTAELTPLDKIIGQDRAVRAIDFGVDIDAPGYNIYAVGPAGSGRTTTVKQFLNQRASQRPAPADWCYVNNFADPRHPHALSLPPGQAVTFKNEMAELVEQLRRDIPRAFEGEVYEQRRREIVLELQRKQAALIQELDTYLAQRGFSLIRSQAGMAIAPVLQGQVLSGEDYDKLDPEVKAKFEAYRPELQEQFDKTMRLTRQIDREGRQAIDKVTHDIAGFVIDQSLEELRDKFKSQPSVLEYLAAVRNDAVENADNLIVGPDDQKPTIFGPSAPRDEFLTRYQVNVLAEIDTCRCAPIVVEDNPTYSNLIGRIEHTAEFGTMVTDYTQIRAGALHRANGGYLIVEAKNLLSNTLAWEALKRAIRSRQVKIEEMASFYGLVASASLEPEPIPLDIKVVIIGDEQLYDLLFTYDDDFRELFKVKAQFVSQIPRDAQTAQNYAQFIGTLCKQEALRHFTPEAVGQVIDEASRLVEDQGRVSTRLAQVADLVRESSFWAQKAQHELVQIEDVRATIQERVLRRAYVAERYRESIQDGIILIRTEGNAVGQINGLSVVQAAGYEFGIPSRVTAKTFIGRSGVVSIDREVKMSGPIHDKGQLILAAYLSGRFAQQHALSMSATLSFEQMYSGVEGDSASSTELYAILSSLAHVPIRQDLAVTGSVNQFGQVQAIGGVNAKIEGFYDLCVSAGLSNTQGVMIPSSNVRHLMLREDIVQAVRDGRFHIYSVSTIEEGIEILTGIPAGETDSSGKYPEGSVYAQVDARLAEYQKLLESKNKEGNELQDAKPATNPADTGEGVADETT
ncbi:MAG: AAA family ATPase [Chloroflexi bacterium]|nr:AAA family ATPase [Chloroflexota bacterium]